MHKMMPPKYYNDIANQATGCECCKTCIVKMCCEEICSNWVDEQVERLASEHNTSPDNIKQQIINYGIQNNLPYK